MTGRPAARPPEDQARERGVLQPADRREGPERVARAGAVERHGPPDQLRLARDVLGAPAGALARHRGRVGPGHRGHQARGRRGVADAHVAAEQDVGALGRPRRRSRAGQDRRLGLGARHRGGPADVAGAGAHPLPVEPGVGRRLAGHADVEHADVAAHDRREGARGRAPGADRLDHGRRHVARPGGRPARDDAVVAGADDQRGPGRGPRVGAPRDAREDDAELLEPPQAPGRLREGVPSPARGLGGALVDRDDRGHELVEGAGWGVSGVGIACWRASVGLRAGRPDPSLRAVTAMRRLLLLRHAPTAATRRAAFSADEPLDERGAAAAAALRGRFRSAGESYASPAGRARETARLAGLDADVEPALAECDFGAWAGHRLDELAASDPDGVRRWLDDPTARPHGGETMVELMDRVARWLDGQAAREGAAVAVTHGGPIRAAVLHALGAPAEAFWRVDAAPLSLTELHADAGRWRLVRLNASP